MNDVLTILRKAGERIWLLKEKMVLLILVAILCFRVYVVLSTYSAEGSLEGEDSRNGITPTPRPATARPADVGLPPPRPDLPRPMDYSGLIRRNPFTVWGVAREDASERTPSERIDVSLIRIVRWGDGTYRAEISVKGDKPKRFEEGEPFVSYRLERIDPETQTVVIFSEEHNRSFVVSAQNRS